MDLIIFAIVYAAIGIGMEAIGVEHPAWFMLTGYVLGTISTLVIN